MIGFILWRCCFALCLLSNQVWGLCTEQNVQIEGGNYTLSHQLEEGSVLTYQCEEGFYPYPAMARVCNRNDMWEPSHSRSKCMQVECPNPRVLENCAVLPNKQQYTYQTQITYECHTGYTLHGPSRRTCLSSGKWSGSHPVCRPDSAGVCPDPGVPPGGSRTLSSVDAGIKVTYTCGDYNKILIGSEERVCRGGGSWSGIEPTCYYPYTYDSPLEVAQVLAGALKKTVELEKISKPSGKTIKLLKSGTLNVYIGVDVSSITEQQFENVKKVILTLTRKFEALSVTPNYEILFFSSEPTEAVDIFSFFKDNRIQPSFEMLFDNLKDYLLEWEHKTETNLNAVFLTFLEKISVIKYIHSNFKDHQHVILLFTDGRYNKGGNPIHTIERIKSLVLMDQPKEREKHLDIFVFGIGAQIYDDSLKSLTAGPGYRHYFRLKDYEQLPEALDEMIKEENIEVCGRHRDNEYMPDPQTRRRKYPWFMRISAQTFSGATSSCLGSLVSPRFVLTAAHCFTVYDFIFKLIVEVDMFHQLDVKKLHIHPQYNMSAKAHLGIKEFYDYDVALIELTKDVDFSSSLIPICLPCTAGTNIAIGQTLTCQQQEQLMLNHGRIKFFTRDLREKEALIKFGDHRVECIHKALYAPGILTQDASMVVTENFLCSGGTFPERDNIACRGEGGGAVFKNRFNRTIQVALVSWGNKLVPNCQRHGITVSDDDSRDFHINLFKVVPFLKSILGRTDESYSPLVFVD